MKWRVIPLQMNSAYRNMAIDEAISESVAKGLPTIRFYKWLPSALSIGYFQSLNDVVDLSKCEEQGIDVVRRRTGGGAVYHSNFGEITYSVIGKQELFPKNIIESYKEICGWVIKGLKNMGINSEFIPINDILVNGKKISGNAQTRRSGVLLQHGTVLYDVNVEKMFSLLIVPDEKIKDKMIKAVKDRVTRVLDYQELSQQQAYKALLKGFTQDKNFDMGELTETELARAAELEESRYSTKQWNHMK